MEVIADASALGKGVLVEQNYDWAIIPSSPTLSAVYDAFPGTAVRTLLSFASGGGNIAFLGGKPPTLNVTAQEIELNVM